MVCHYHDCLRGTIDKPDYRLVEDKLYFDFSMKYMFDDEEPKKVDLENEQNKTDEEETKIVCKNQQVKIKLPKKKSNAMVINHKIYF